MCQAVGENQPESVLASDETPRQQPIVQHHRIQLCQSIADQNRPAVGQICIDTLLEDRGDMLPWNATHIKVAFCRAGFW